MPCGGSYNCKICYPELRLYADYCEAQGPSFSPSPIASPHRLPSFASNNPHPVPLPSFSHSFSSPFASLPNSSYRHFLDKVADKYPHPPQQTPEPQSFPPPAFKTEYNLSNNDPKYICLFFFVILPS
ncbi:hypothetical protein PUN28_017978 [Cardiocondyla obscurior]|uniref:Uncharacterized protein n=1 Tax=Cardiocondyla obscurior TaxID=286306 RepID=A0AAW2EJ57_9HYME